MTAVFSHGRLRLYLLKLLDDGPKHGYELIRLLEDRFLGLYAPSAGTIYPRLQRMEAEGLVKHTAAGGRKVYEITEAGREELRQRSAELTELESDIRSSVADLASLAGEIQTEVRGSIRDLKRELRAATQETRRGRWAPPRTNTNTTPPRPEEPRYDQAPPEEPRYDQARSAAGGDAAAEFDRRLTELVEEVRALVRGRRFTDSQLRVAVRVLDGTLDGLRRLLR